MSANPALVRVATGEMVPAPFPEETFVLKRSGIQLDLDSVHTASGKWSAKGFLFLSNVRMVFIAEQPDAASGLVGFDFPLLYLRNDTLNQPIFGCNNLSGEVWSAVPGGGPAGSLPPHTFKVYFKTGGIGTFYPLYYTLTERAKQAMEQAQQRRQPVPHDANPSSYADSLASKAFVDPNDPSIVYLSQPTDESQRLQERPRYAAIYGQEGETEKYEGMH